MSTIRIRTWVKEGRRLGPRIRNKRIEAPFNKVVQRARSMSKSNRDLVYEVSVDGDRKNCVRLTDGKVKRCPRTKPKDR